MNNKNSVFAEVLAAHVAKTRFIAATITNGANAQTMLIRFEINLF